MCLGTGSTAHRCYKEIRKQNRDRRGLFFNNVKDIKEHSLLLSGFFDTAPTVAGQNLGGKNS